MTTTTLDLRPTTRAVEVNELTDGRLVRLAGPVGAEAAAELRLALLAPLPEGFRDVVVDVGDVSHLDDDALAVVLAAAAWTRDHGARFSLCRLSPALAQEIRALQLDDTLQELAAL